MLKQTTDIRSEFELALFAYYQANVQGTYCGYDPIRNEQIPGSGPPVLTESSQVWGLIDEPVVCIPRHFRTQSAIEFELSFNCDWDPEHGLGVLYRDWHPLTIASWDL